MSEIDPNDPYKIQMPFGHVLSVTKANLKAQDFDSSYHRMAIAIRLLYRHEITISEAYEAISEWCEDRVWNATVGS
jgi:hypothetical protein